MPSSRLLFLATFERKLALAGVFLAPFRNLKLESVFFSLSDLIYCVSLFLLLVSGRLPAAPLGRSTQLWGLAFLMLTAGLLGSSVVNGDPLRGVIVLGQYFFAYILLLFVLIRDDEQFAHRLMMAFLISMMCINIHGIVSFLVLGQYAGGTSDVITGGKRLGTLLANPNTAAAINSFSLPMLYYLWLSSRLRTPLALGALAIIATTVVLTGSNSGMISVALGAIVYIMVAGNKRTVMYFSLACAALVLAIMAIGVDALPDAFRERVLSTFSSGDLAQAGTLLDRIALMREGVAFLQEHEVLLLGVGADQFRVMSQYSAPVHNTYMLIFLEGGVFALLGWLLFIIIGVRIGLIARLSGADPNLGAMVISAFVVFAFFGGTHAHIYARYYLTPLMLCLSLAMIELRQRAAVAQLQSEAAPPS